MSQSFENLFNDVLSESTELTEDEQSALKLVFGSLTSLLQASESSDPECTFNQLEANGTDLAKTGSDADLVERLGRLVDSAAAIVELLQQRSLNQHCPQPLHQLELQFVATQINVEALQAATQAETLSKADWKQQIQTLLLYEFNFINRWVRGAIH